MALGVTGSAQASAWRHALGMSFNSTFGDAGMILRRDGAWEMTQEGFRVLDRLMAPSLDPDNLVSRVFVTELARQSEATSRWQFDGGPLPRSGGQIRNRAGQVGPGHVRLRHQSTE